MGFPGGSDGKESTYNSGDMGLIPGWEKITWRRATHSHPWLPPLSSLHSSGHHRTLDRAPYTG